MNREEIIKLIESLNINEYTDSWDVGVAIGRKKIEGVSCHHGATKCCLVFDKLDFVIKWSPCSGKEAFAEVVTYEKAKEKNLAFLFPKTNVFTTINGINFIAQEKIDFSCSDTPRYLKEKYEKQSRTVKNRIYHKMEIGFQLGTYCDRDLNRLWASMVISLYGKKVAKALCDFIRENKINDLHGNNLGYKNNRPIILDFSGYY